MVSSIQLEVGLVVIHLFNMNFHNLQDAPTGEQRPGIVLYHLLKMQNCLLYVIQEEIE